MSGLPPNAGVTVVMGVFSSGPVSDIRRECLSSRQLVQQRFCVFQIARIKPFSEPAVDRSEQVAGLITLALIAPEPRHAYRGAEFPGLRLLPARIP